MRLFDIGTKSFRTFVAGNRQTGRLSLSRPQRVYVARCNNVNQTADHDGLTNAEEQFFNAAQQTYQLDFHNPESLVSGFLNSVVFQLGWNPTQPGGGGAVPAADGPAEIILLEPMGATPCQ